MPCTAPRALAWYLLLTLAFTWPMAAGLRYDVPRDLGDSLLNSWILGWNASHILEALRGNPGVLAGLWHANIFHPEPYTLAYSELLLAPAVQIVPVYALTGNLLLCYNLLYLSTYVLSGLGMFLLARAFTADWRAAFVAGLLYAFTPYRVNQGPHLQVMSSQWMPFVLFGFHQFVQTRRLRAAIGGAVALVAQNLSCGYFMIFFAPFVPAFVLFEIHRARAWRSVKVWAGFALAALITAVATLPAMVPYTALRNLRDSRRPIEEILVYSADAWGWLSADEQLAFWGPILTRWGKPEGQLFPGALPIVLAVIAIVAGISRTWRASAAAPANTAPPASTTVARRVIVGGLVLLGVSALALAGAALTGLAGQFLPELQRPVVRFENHVIALAIVGALLLVLSSRARAIAAMALRSPLLFATVATFVAWYLSLGPVPQAGGHLILGPRLYSFLLDHLPGMDGLRVPARYAMLVVMFLALVSAWGVRVVLARRSAFASAAMVVALSALWMGETWNAPITMNYTMGSGREDVIDPPSRVPTGESTPALAAYLRGLPAGAVLIEFPFAAGGWEMRYVYYSTLHWRPIVNGFSGWAPPSYRAREKVLRDPYDDPDEAWAAVVASGATHVVVHGQAYLRRDRPAPYEWLATYGARPVARFGQDDVFEVPRP